MPVDPIIAPITRQESDSPCDHLSIRIYSAWGFTITSCTVLWARSESVTSCGSDLREPLPGGAGHLANTQYSPDSPGARPVIEKWPTWSVFALRERKRL